MNLESLRTQLSFFRRHQNNVAGTLLASCYPISDGKPFNYYQHHRLDCALQHFHLFSAIKSAEQWQDKTAIKLQIGDPEIRFPNSIRMLSSISKATHHGCLIASSVSRHHVVASSMMAMNPSSCRQVAIRYNNFYFRGVSSQAAAATVPSIISRGISLNLNKNLLLHRRAISSTSYITRGSNNNYHQYNNSSQQKRSQRVFLEIALFSSALYGATTATPINATYENTSTATTRALCSNKDSSSSSNENDEDFISKVKSKINSQSISDLSSSLPTNINMDELLTTLGTQTQLALNSGIPTNLSYGFFAGYLSGFALKKIGRVASLSLGVGFVILQTLAYQGYIDVNHDKLKKKS